MASHFGLLDRVNSVVISAYNFFCAKILFALRYPFMRKTLVKNKQLRNKHKGEKCFILGLGPSLKKVDLSLLKNEVTFCVNHFNKYDKERILSPQYYCLLDNAFYMKESGTTKELAGEYLDTKFFVNIKGKKIFKKDRLANIHYLYSRYIQHKNYIKYDASKCMTAGLNVINFCIQLALYMGFSEIYLLGCDFNYITTRFEQQHAYGSTVSVAQTGVALAGLLQEFSATLVHHDALDKKAKKMGVKIYNATLESYITSYEFKDIKEVLVSADGK